MLCSYKTERISNSSQQRIKKLNFALFSIKYYFYVNLNFRIINSKKYFSGTQYKLRKKRNHNLFYEFRFQIIIEEKIKIKFLEAQSSILNEVVVLDPQNQNQHLKFFNTKLFNNQYLLFF